MQLFSWLHKRMTSESQPRRTPARKPTPRFRPQLEALEDRLVPSTLTVTNNLDTGVAGDGSLRGEIAAAKSNDTIVFDTSLSGQSINLYTNAAVGELVINKNLTIQGPSSPLSPITINGGYSRIFEVDGAKTIVSLSNLNINIGNGVANNPLSVGATDGEGGAIWNGGTLTVNACNLINNSAVSGFPAGLGGAIYNAGTLTVSNSTLNNNSVYHSDFDHTYSGDGGAIYNAGTNISSPRPTATPYSLILLGKPRQQQFRASSTSRKRRLSSTLDVTISTIVGCVKTTGDMRRRSLLFAM
jgi:hypothetical protein